MMYYEEEGIVLFNDALNTFYLWLYGLGYIMRHVMASSVPIYIHNFFFLLCLLYSYLKNVPPRFKNIIFWGFNMEMLPPWFVIFTVNI